jgi:hypothetical protein
VTTQQNRGAVDAKILLVLRACLTRALRTHPHTHHGRRAHKGHSSQQEGTCGFVHLTKRESIMSRIVAIVGRATWACEQRERQNSHLSTRASPLVTRCDLCLCWKTVCASLWSGLMGTKQAARRGQHRFSVVDTSGDLSRWCGSKGRRLAHLKVFKALRKERKADENVFPLHAQQAPLQSLGEIGCTTPRCKPRERDGHRVAD